MSIEQLQQQQEAHLKMIKNLGETIDKLMEGMLILNNLVKSHTQEINELRTKKRGWFS